MTAITVANIVLRDVEPPIIKAAQVPEGEFLIDTRPERRDGTRPADVVPGPVEPGEPWVIDLSFDNQDLWAGSANPGTSAFAFAGGVLPSGFDAARNDPPSWASEPAIRITDDADKVRSPGGKSLQINRFSASGWNSDGVLTKHVPLTQSLYLSVWLKFQPGWTWAGSSKIFRAMYKLKQDQADGYFDYNYNRPDAAEKLPAWLWNYNHYSTSGYRNRPSFRSNAGGTTWSNPPIVDLPRSGSSSDLSLNWDADMRNLDGGTGNNNPQIPDLVNGGFLQPGVGAVTHAQVVGDVWHRHEFYAQLNSAPGATDGVFAHWFDGEIIFLNTKMPWIQADGVMTGWNLVSLGGNSFFTELYDGTQIDDADQITEWYVIADPEVRNHLPEHLTLEPKP